MKWPRGRWNGQRIVGIDCKLIIDITNWHFFLPNGYGSCLWLGPARIFIGAAYDDRERIRAAAKGGV